MKDDERPHEQTEEKRYGNVERWRHEYKYMIDARQQEILKIRAAGVMMRDPHVREDGTYQIHSLYFDDWNDSCLSENLAGTDPRSKYRMRYYNSAPEMVLLEKKSKYRGMCRKESCILNKEESRQLIQGQIPLVNARMNRGKQKLLTELELGGLKPKMIVSYERIPFIYEGGNVRVTFDCRISSSAEIERFLEGNYMERPVLPAGGSILEVKWDEVLPRHIRETLQMEHLEWTAFSKYYMCRRFHL